MSKKKDEIEIPTVEEMTIEDVVKSNLTEEDAVNLNEPKKVNLIEDFIDSKPELARYSMSTAFKNFCAKNKATYNDLKTKEDIQRAFDKFFT